MRIRRIAAQTSRVNPDRSPITICIIDRRMPAPDVPLISMHMTRPD
ncbi:hypothetical protein SAMN06295970_11157 [Noviherbaspirillum suwonense]|uniref:Uncharacterized protein n=1 Tax=Noviherbaspirillum suwonense TaxID=1224511 RepID=A0ABY1QAP1_9BURK|nr:hypothetical protein SAMN06295970_11157 [Noviherbaspirillum suwonense]